MKPRTIGRVVAALICAAGVAIGVRHDHAVGRAEGKEAFLMAQAARFDKSFARPESLLGDCVITVVAAGVVFGGYEALSWGLYLLIKSRSKGSVA